MDAQDVRGEVDLVDIGSPALRTLHATVTGEQDGLFELRIDDVATDGPAVGGLVVIHWVGRDLPRISAVVIHREGPHLRAVERRRTPKDRRRFPRTVGGIALRYRVVPAEQAPVVAARWMAGAPDVAPADAWREPDPFMNFSASGLRFDEAPVCAPGDHLLCEVGVGGRPERWRAVARVVRVDPVDEAERLGDETHQVAVAFRDLPSALADALEGYTLQLQRLSISL